MIVRRDEKFFTGDHNEEYVFENSLFYIRAIHTTLYRVCYIEYRISEVKDECKHRKTLMIL